MQRAPRTVLTAAFALAVGIVFSHACAQGKKGPDGAANGDAGDAGDAGDSGETGNGDPADAGNTSTGTADAGCKSDSFCGANRWCDRAAC